jgi:hypothetical protein
VIFEFGPARIHRILAKCVEFVSPGCESPQSDSLFWLSSNLKMKMSYFDWKVSSSFRLNNLWFFLRMSSANIYIYTYKKHSWWWCACHCEISVVGLRWTDNVQSTRPEIFLTSSSVCLTSVVPTADSSAPPSSLPPIPPSTPFPVPPPPRFLLFLQCQTCPNTCAMLRRGVRVAPANLQCLLHLANLYAITTSPPHPVSATADLCYPTASLSSTSTTTPLLPRPSSSPEVHTIISASCQLCHVC